MQVRNTVIHRNIPFEEYLKIGGRSFSSLSAYKWNGMVTDRMRFGSAVHNYLHTPKDYVSEFPIKMVQNAAAAVRDVLGALFGYLEFELSITSEFIHEGFLFPYKGRADQCIPKKIVIDLKLTEKLARDHFDTDGQVNGYAAALECPLCFVIACNPKTFKAEVVPIPRTDKFWEQVCLKRGTPLFKIQQNENI